MRPTRIDSLLLTRAQYDELIARGIVRPAPGEDGSGALDVVDEGAMRDQVEIWRARRELKGWSPPGG